MLGHGDSLKVKDFIYEDWDHRKVTGKDINLWLSKNKNN